MFSDLAPPAGLDRFTFKRRLVCRPYSGKFTNCHEETLEYSGNSGLSQSFNQETILCPIRTLLHCYVQDCAMIW